MNFWGTWCPPCVVETPAAADRLRRPTRTRASPSSASTSRTARAMRRARSSPTTTSPTRSIYDENGETALRMGNIRVPGPPFTVLLDREHRVAGVYLGRLTPKDLEPMLDKLSAGDLIAVLARREQSDPHRAERPAAVRSRRRRAGRRDRFPVTVRASARARISVLRSRAVRRRHASRASAGWPLGALLFVLGFTAIFVLQGVLFGQLGAAISDHRLALERVHGCRHDRARHRVPRRGRLAAARVQGAPAAATGPARGAGARRHLRAGLDAVPDPDLQRRGPAVAVAGHGRPRRVPHALLLPRPRHPVHARGARLRLGASALGFVRRHRRIVSGSAAGC